MRLNSIFTLCSLVGASAILALAAACSPQPVPTPPSSPTTSATGTPSAPLPSATARATPRLLGGSIVIAAIGQPSHEVTSLPPFIANALYDSLLRVDPTDGSLKAGLAESWQVSDDARTFTFRLRPGVRWHDGQPLTAQDVLFTIQAMSAPDVRLTVPAADFGQLTEVTAPDSQTVRVTFKVAYCPALTSIGAIKILPEHILGTPASPTLNEGGQNGTPTSTPAGKGEMRGVASLAPDQFVGTGPLVLKTWTADSITFTSNGYYWNGAPAIADWTYKIFANVADAQAALKRGQVDLLSLEAGQAAGIPAPAGVKTVTRPMNQFYSLAINQEQGIFADARVRQALAAALNRPSLAADLFGKDAQVLQTSLLPTFWASPTDAAQPSYDPTQARKLLADAGWSDTDGDGILDKNGKPLQVTLWAVADDPDDEPLAFDIRNMLAQAGFQVLLQLDDRDEMLTRLFLHEFDLAVAPWNIPLDPDQHWFWQSTENTPGEGLNFASYSNPQVDDLMQHGNLVPRCDSNARRTIYAQAYRAIAKDLPQVFLLAPPVYVEARTRVVGLEPSAFAGDFWNINSWGVAP
jgi:peptide/nickel transport system substrate-binding protein